MELSETLFPLLSKEGIQVRMFDLTNLLSSFLAKLQARTFTEARTRSERRRELEWAINASKNSAQQRLTVRTLPGLQLSRNISDGYTRVFRGFEEEIARRAEEAHALATQIEAVSESLGQMAGMEERAWQKKNEAATNRLNRVLALVAVLAAIPLLVGQFDTDALSTVFAAILSRAFGWLPFRYDFQAFPYWTVGLWISFLGALVAVTLTLWTLATTSGKPRSDKDERRGFVSKARQCSEALFDSYREYKDADFGKMGLNGVDALDRRTAESVAIAMDHCAEWHREEVGEEIEIIRAERDPWWTRFLGARYRERRKRNRLDRAWAREAERQVCRFVVASDVFDLRPEKFHLPATLCLYRWKYASAALGSSPVSDWEFQLVMGGFDYTETEIRALEVWAISNQIEEKTASQAREAILAAGITAFNEVDLSEEIAALEAMEVEADIPDEGQETDSAPDQETPRSRQ